MPPQVGETLAAVGNTPIISLEPSPFISRMTRPDAPVGGLKTSDSKAYSVGVGKQVNVRSVNADSLIFRGNGMVTV